MAETFKTLSDPTRVRILYLLSRKELCVHDIAQLLGISQPAASHHLRVLRMLRLVRTRRAGRSTYYAPWMMSTWCNSLVAAMTM